MNSQNKKHYTLNRAAEILQRDVEDIISELIARNILPCIRLGPMNGKYVEGPAPPCDTHEEGGWIWDGRSIDEYGTSANSDTWYIATFPHQRIYYDENKDPYIRVCECFLSKYRTSRGEWFVPKELIDWKDDIYYLVDLVICEEELEHHSQGTMTTGESDALSTRLENNYLKTIALLVRIYLEAIQGEDFSSRTPPVVSHIVERILQHITDHELDIYGVGESTLHVKITNALESLDTY